MNYPYLRQCTRETTLSPVRVSDSQHQEQNDYIFWRYDLTAMDADTIECIFFDRPVYFATLKVCSIKTRAEEMILWSCPNSTGCSEVLLRNSLPILALRMHHRVYLDVRTRCEGEGKREEVACNRPPDMRCHLGHLQLIARRYQYQSNHVI